MFRKTRIKRKAFR